MEGSWPCFHRNLPNKWLLDIYGIHNHWKHGISRKVGWVRTKGSTELLTWGMVWMHRKALSGRTDTLWQHHGTGETLTRTFGREQELDAFEKPVGAIDNQHLQNQNRGGDGTYCAEYMCVVLGNFYCWFNRRNDLLGEQTNCLRPFSSVKKWLPSPRTCLKTRSSFLGLVTRWSFQKPLHRWTSSEPPGLFPHELEQFFFTVAGKGMVCTGKSVLYLASVRLSIWKCLFTDDKLGHLEKIYAIVWYWHKIAMFQKNTFT